MLNMWTEENYARLDGSIHYEHDAIMRAFAVYEKLGLEGGVLRSGGKIIGFSMGEMVSARPIPLPRNSGATATA